MYVMTSAISVNVSGFISLYISFRDQSIFTFGRYNRIE